MKGLVRSLTLLAIVATLWGSCRKEDFTTSPGATLRVSADTLHFDTVFTSTGSTSGVLKIYNDNRKSIRLSAVRLAGGPASPFKINVDGTPGPLVKDLTILPRDSLYLFVTVSINPSLVPLPFVVRDSIVLDYNGQVKRVQLDAYGQNAHFLRNAVIKTSQTWRADLPYVILGGLVVDTAATLTIGKGVKVFLHADAPLIIKGSLKVEGEKWDSTRVLFTGDRLDEPYRNFPASYPGLIFTQTSRDNVLTYAIIKNAYEGIIVTGGGPGTKLTLNETIIDNAYEAGLIGVNTSISASNLLISNCGKNLVLVNGGTYDFNHCTVATFSSPFIQHKNPVLLLTNHLQTGITAPLNARFRNSIFWGEANGIVKDEVVVSRQGTAPFKVDFEGILWRVQTTPAAAGITISGVINNQPPLFDSINTAKPFYSFRLRTGSPALNKGVATGLGHDLDGAPRPVGLPDLGAYEKQ